MNRLQSELRRLFHCTPDSDGLLDAQGRSRALVLELVAPADWAALAPVWRGVQAELALPAPAIAVNGLDGFQLWFSLPQPLAAEQARAFGAALCARFLPGLAPARLRLLPAPDAALRMPPAQQGPEQWAAFVAPDLAPVFADKPWLDIPPGEDGQAELLSALASIGPEAFAAAQARLSPAQAPIQPAAAVPSAGAMDPRDFLLRVMHDELAPLALRVEAAKALLANDAGKR